MHTCSNQRLICGRACIDSWLASTGNSEGHVMDLARLWRLAQHWYDGRLDRGYARREPSEAKDYLRQAGPHGAFLGLPD